MLTVKEWASTNWDVAVVDDEAKCEIGYGENENKNDFRPYKIDFTANGGD